MSKAAEEEDEEAVDSGDIGQQIENYIARVIDRPVNPTEEITHVPGQNMSLQDLHADWPNTPLSTTGLAESVQQRIEWLAHRIPHGYQTPVQLAERYAKGHLTRFESEEEKETVMKLAADIAQNKAQVVMEKKGTEIKAKDMSFVDVASRPEERGALADRYVRGKYPELLKQKMPFLDQIVRNLRNNGTYHDLEKQQFMETVQKLMAQQGGQAQKTT